MMPSNNTATHRKILLVVDGSESAHGLWAEVSSTAFEILRIAPAGAIQAVALLGTSRRWDPAEWTATMPLFPDHAGATSFIGPVCREMQRRVEPVDAIVVVGSGEVFDLGDWVDIAGDWAFVRVGEASLLPGHLRLHEYGREELEALSALLFARTASAHAPPIRHALSGAVDQEWSLDTTGYPMIHVPPLGRYMHLFPTTKVQFEAFLAECTALPWGDGWYHDLLRISPRISPANLRGDVYEHLFATGLLYSEVQQLTRWYGADYEVPTVEAWQSARDWLSEQPLSVLPAPLETGMARPALQLWHGLLRARAPQSLLDLSLMMQGIIEWVNLGKDEGAGMGDPRQSFYPGFHSNPFIPTSKLRRSKFWGCRLLRS